MKITVTFDTLEEFDAFRGAPTIWREVPAPAEEKEAEAPAPEEKKAEPVKKEPEVPFEEGPMPAPNPAPEPEKKAEAPAVSESMRTTIRKALADLNKKAGENVAKALINQAGYKKLTDIPLEKLPELADLIREKEEEYA